MESNNNINLEENILIKESKEFTSNLNNLIKVHKLLAKAFNDYRTNKSSNNPEKLEKDIIKTSEDCVAWQHVIMANISELEKKLTFNDLRNIKAWLMYNQELLSIINKTLNLKPVLIIGRADLQINLD